MINKILLVIVLLSVLIIFYIFSYARNKCIEDVYNINFWKKLYGTHQSNLLNFIIKVRNYLEKHNIKYWMYGGTLLGSVRHGGFIPWDDDVDFAYLSNYDNISALISDLKSNGFLIEYMFFGFKIKNQENPNEFIDMFEFFPRDDGLYPTKDTLNLWPNEFFPYDEVNNLHQAKFENTTFPAPSNPEKYCKRTYGEDCLTKFKLQTPHFDKHNNYYSIGLNFCADKEFFIKHIKN